MTKLIIMAMVLLFCLVRSVQSQTSLDAASKNVINSLTKDGTIILDYNDTDMFIYVEPLFWSKLTHAQKKALVISGMVTAKGKDGVIVQDMTSRSTLATGTIETKRIRIYK